MFFFNLWPRKIDGLKFSDHVTLVCNEQVYIKINFTYLV